MEVGRPRELPYLKDSLGALLRVNPGCERIADGLCSIAQPGSHMYGTSWRQVRHSDRPKRVYKWPSWRGRHVKNPARALLHLLRQSGSIGKARLASLYTCPFSSRMCPQP